MLRYLRIELLRMSRDPRFVFFTAAVPVGFYLLWSNIGGVHGEIEASTGLTPQVHLMVSMAAFGAIVAAVASTGSRLAGELQSGWLRQLRATPLSNRAVICTKILASMILALTPIVLVSITAALAQDVRLSPAEWAGMIALMWLATFPFAALGTLIGSLVSPDAAQPVSVGTHLGLSMLGGLFVPISQMPHALQNVAHWLPSNRFGEVGWDIVGGHAPSAAAGLILAGWAAALGGCAIAAYRRATVTA
ncbi:MAG TPA: ABC transporter permease [Streptosporangiaceae bacterium]|jgi:ABC-2 type transport system permease protein